MATPINKLDSQRNLRVEYYPENADFEATAALVIADTFYAVTQEEIIAEDEEIDEDCPCEDCGDGELDDDTFEDDDEDELENATEEGTF